MCDWTRKPALNNQPTNQMKKPNRSWVFHSRFPAPQTIHLFLLCVLVSLQRCWPLLAFLTVLVLVLKHATEKLPSVCISNRYNITLSSPCFQPLMLHAVKGTNQDNKSCKFYTLLIKYKPNVSILFAITSFLCAYL